MANTKMYLRQRNGIWYFRRPVPSDLTELFHSSRFTYSLKTRIRQEAIRAYPAALAQSEEDITQAREKIKGAIKGGGSLGLGIIAILKKRKQEMANRRRTKAFCQYGELGIRALLSRWFIKQQAQTEEAFRKVFVQNTPEKREKILAGLAEDEGQLLGHFPEMDHVVISTVARRILDEDDCDPPHEWLNDPLFCRYYSLLTEGLLKLNRMAMSLVEKGELPENFQQKVAIFTNPVGQVAASGGSAPFSPPASSITLNELITRFENEPKRQHLRESTRKEYGLTYRALREQIGGDKPIGEITRDDIRAVADTFLHLPARATLTNHTERLQDIAARAKAEGKPQAHVKTYNKKVQQISAIFSYAVVEQLIQSNPAQRLALPEPPPNGDEKGYTGEQLQVIFSGSLFRQFIDEGNAQFEPNHPLRPCLFWSPLIALFHGMRSGEILQITTKNVFERDGVPVIKLEGMVKNQYSYRITPIHPEVIRLGFLDYVAEVRKAGYEMAFPDAKKASDGRYSTWFQKPFARYLKEIGIKSSRKECFHAFRHTWVTGMRRADVPEEIRKAIGGWKRGNESAEIGYGAQDFPRLLKYLGKLEYPGLNLPHLQL